MHKSAEPFALIWIMPRRDTVCWGEEVNLRCATLVAALLTAGAAAGQPLTLQIDGAGSKGDQGFISREWVWTTEANTTTFTAHGPSEQVNNLDPQDSPLLCQDCELASSTHFEPGDEVEPVLSR